MRLIPKLEWYGDEFHNDNVWWWTSERVYDEAFPKGCYGAGIIYMYPGLRLWWKFWVLIHELGHHFLDVIPEQLWWYFTWKWERMWLILMRRNRPRSDITRYKLIKWYKLGQDPREQLRVFLP